MDLITENRGQKLLEAAYIWLAEGVSVVPVATASKRISIPWKIFQTKLPSAWQADYWFSAGLVNLAVICGTGDLVCLDFDHPQYYETWSAAAGELAGTYTEKTPRGFHVFFKTDRPVSKDFIGCELKGPGHACNVAPSVLADNNRYEIYGDQFAPIKRTTTEKLFSLLSEKEKISYDLTEKIEPPASGNISTKDSDLVKRIKNKFPLTNYLWELLRVSYPSDANALPKPSGGNGRWFMSKCPLHVDHEPSFSIDTKNQLWRCFSSGCVGSTGGDVINLYALANDINIGEAIRRLAKVTE